MRAPRLALLCAAAALCHAQTIFTFAGLPLSHRASIDSKPALNAPLNFVYGLLIDKTTGRLLLNDERLVARLEPDGTLLAVAGMARGFDGSVANGTLASGLFLQTLRGMAQDASGALYFSDALAGRVFRVAPDGVVTTYAGGTINPYVGGKLATSGSLGSPRGLVFDSKGNLDIAEAYCGCIRQVSPAGIITTLFTIPPRPDFPFQYFEGLAIDAQDNLYGVTYRGSQVWKIAPEGTGVSIAGTGDPGFSGDGGPALSAQLNAPSGVTLDGSGNLYIADTQNHRIRKISRDGTIVTVAGTGVSGFGGDRGPAADAQLSFPAQTAFDAAGNLYVADYGNRRVRVLSSGGVISTVAGNGEHDTPLIPGGNGDSGPALYATFNYATSALFAPSGDLYVADMSACRIRKISPGGTITTIAGNGHSGYSGEGGPAVQATIFNPITVAADPNGSVYFETYDSHVLKVTPDGILHLVAGAGSFPPNQPTGDGGPAINAILSSPKGLTADAAGNVYIGDSGNARLRKVDAGGVITTIAGPGTVGIDNWNALATDPKGNLYAALTRNDINRLQTSAIVYRVSPTGALTGIAGNGQTCPTLETAEFPSGGKPAGDASLCAVAGLAFDPQGTLYIAESHYGVILRLAPDGTLQRIAGTTRTLDLGDGGSPLDANLQSANFYSPPSVAIDRAGNLFVPQSGANRIREIVPGPLNVQFSIPRIDFESRASRQVQVLTNLAEPLPFAVKVTGGSWLAVNRVTGLTGDTLTVSANPSGLGPGTYVGVVQVSVVAATNTIAVTLTVP